MLSLHEILIELRDNLGYTKYKATYGLCVFYAEKGIDAFLVDEFESVFMPRCEYIRKNHSQIPALYQKAKAEIKAKAHSSSEQTIDITTCAADITRENQVIQDESQMIFEVAAFIEQGELYHYPFAYADVFGQSLNQWDLQDISRLAQSATLEQVHKGRAILASFIGIYSLIDLTLYLKQLNKLASIVKSDFALSLSSGDHRIGLCYSHKKQSWILIDINRPSLVFIPANDDVVELFAKDIVGTFVEDNNENITAFETKIITTGAQQALMQEYVNEWQENKEFIAIHKMTLQRSSYQTSRGFTLAYLAATLGHTKTLNKIIELYQPVDINSEFEDKSFNKQLSECLNAPGSAFRVTTLIDIAAQNGHTAVIQTLADLKTLEGDWMVSLDHLDLKSITPIFRACEAGHADIVEFLMNTKTSDGNYRVNIDRVSNDGFAPIHAAIKGGNTNLVRMLVEAKLADGNYRVNIDRVNNDGIAPIHLAIIGGYINELRMLVEAKLSDGHCRVDINRNFQDFSPLRWAIFHRRTEIIRILIAAGADINCLYKGISLLEHAEYTRCADIINLVKQAISSQKKPQGDADMKNKAIIASPLLTQSLFAAPEDASSAASIELEISAVEPPEPVIREQEVFIAGEEQKLLGDENLANSGLINKIEKTVSTRLRQ